MNRWTITETEIPGLFDVELPDGHVLSDLTMGQVVSVWSNDVLLLPGVLPKPTRVGGELDVTFLSP